MNIFKKLYYRFLSNKFICIGDPMKLHADRRFKQLRKDEQIRIANETMAQTKEVTSDISLLAHFYGIKPWEVKKLTKIQKAGLLWNLPNVIHLSLLIQKKTETPEGLGEMLDGLDPNKAKEGISYFDLVKIKSEVNKMSRHMKIGA